MPPHGDRDISLNQGSLCDSGELHTVHFLQTVKGPEGFTGWFEITSFERHVLALLAFQAGGFQCSLISTATYLRSST